MPEPEPISLASAVENKINTKIADGVNFKEQSARNDAIAEIKKEHPHLNQSSVAPKFTTVLQRTIRNQGGNPKEYVKHANRPAKISETLAAKSSPQPVSIAKEIQNTEQKPPATQTNSIAEPNPEMGKQIAKLADVICRIIDTSITSMTDQEIADIGDMFNILLQPIFARYPHAPQIVAGLSIAGFFAQRIYKAKKDKAMLEPKKVAPPTKKINSVQTNEPQRQEQAPDQPPMHTEPQGITDANPNDYDKIEVKQYE